MSRSLVASSKWSFNQGTIYRDLRRSFKAGGRLREVVVDASLTVVGFHTIFCNMFVITITIYIH